MKRILTTYFLSALFLLTLFVAGTVRAEEKPFVTVWKVDDANKKITFPGLGKFTLKYKLVGSAEAPTNLGEVNVTDASKRKVIDFPAAGEYEVEASHEITGLYARGAINREALLQVKQWGTAKWKDLANAFEGCASVDILASAGVPTLTEVKSLSRTFAQCKNLTADLKDWDVTNVEDFTAMFVACTLFNSNLSTWNIAKAKSITNMFAGAAKFNQDLSAWKNKLTACTKMNRMFYGCSDFEGTSLKEWDVSHVTNMSQMFEGCTEFNGDLSAWNVEQVTDMAGMFAGCAAFAANLANWKVTKVTDMSNMFNGCRLFNSDLKNWNVANVKKMEGIFSGCYSFSFSIKDWKLTALLAGEKKISIENVAYNEAKVDELLTTWKARNYKRLEIIANGLYYSSSMAATVAELKDDNGQYKWRLPGFNEAKPGQFKFADRVVTMQRGERKAMPAFEGQFLSHRVLLMDRDPEVVAQTWKITDVTDKAKPGEFVELKENRDIELVAVFQKETRTAGTGKHFVQLNVYGSGQGTVTGNLGATAIQIGDNLVDNSTNESELTLAPAMGSKFMSVTLRSEGEDDNDKPTGYYRFGGDNLKVKVPKSDRNLVIDVVFDKTDVTEFSAPDYKLYVSTVGSGKGKIQGKIAETDFVAGENTVRKTDEVSYTIVPEAGSKLEKLLIIEKDTRIFATSVGETSWSLKYEDRQIESGGGLMSDPVKAPESRKLLVLVQPSPLKNMELQGLAPSATYEWYVGKTLTADFGKPGHPKIVYTPENATNKSITWSFEPNNNEEYVDVASQRAKKGTPPGVKIRCIGISNADPSLKIEFEAVIKEKLVTKVLVGSNPGKIWTTKPGTPEEIKGEGIELGADFLLLVQIEPEDASNQEYDVAFSPEGIIKPLGKNIFRAMKVADEVTMTVTSRSSSHVVNTKKFKVWKEPVSGIEIRKAPEKIELKKGTLRLKWRVLPLADEENGIKGATVKTVRFEVSDISVMKPKVHPGNFKLLKTGKCDITVISLDDETKRATVTIEVVAPTTGIEEEALAQTTVMPNPFAEKLSVAGYELWDGSYELLNTQGVVVLAGRLTPKMTEIHTTELTSGIYMLRLIAPEGTTRTIKVVKY